MISYILDRCLQSKTIDIQFHEFLYKLQYTEKARFQMPQINNMKKLT